MSNPRQGQTLFVGIGSPHGDDRIGWRIADLLGTRMPPDISIRKAATPSDLLDWLEGIDRLIICDACLSRGGTPQDEVHLHRWEWPTLEIAALRSAGTHAFGLPQVLQLAERLGTLPPDVTVLGLEGLCFDAFAELSPEVAAAIDSFIPKIQAVCAGRHASEAAHHA